MPLRRPHLVSLAILLAFAGCKGGADRNPNRDFNPPLVAENDQVKCEVRRVQQRGRSLRIWLNLENKTEDTLELDYGDFQANAEGRSATGALRVPFVRVDKGFDMPPKFYKQINQPIEFLDLPQMQTVQVKLRNIRIRGKEGTSELAVEVPVRDPPKSTAAPK